jgi:hypothetical protein
LATEGAIAVVGANAAELHANRFAAWSRSIAARRPASARSLAFSFSRASADAIAAALSARSRRSVCFASASARCAARMRCARLMLAFDGGTEAAGGTKKT